MIRYIVVKSGFLILFLVLINLLLNPCIAFEDFSTNRIIYVGGNGSGNYSFIQDAVDAASDGDTIYVYNGTYYEHLRIEKPINLIGENRENTIINGENNGNCVFINASYVTISGFTIENTKDNGIYVHGLFHKGRNLNISDNIIKNNYYGIQIYHSLNNIISSNIIQNNFVGVHLDTVDSSIISKNYILNNSQGLVLYFTYGTKPNTIFHNQIKNNQAGITIAKTWFRLDKIFYNNFINNTVYNAYFLNCKTRWYKNYWDDAEEHTFFYLVKGNYVLHRLPNLSFCFFQIDCNPAKKPYLI